jgi:hypothetical protein
VTTPSRIVARLARVSFPALALVVAASLLPAQTLRIASPADGAVVYSGRTFVVTVEASPGAFKQVSVIGTGRIAMPELRYVPPYRFTRRVPPTTSSGTYYVTAIGVTASGESVESRIEVDVERPDPPVTIRNELPALIVDVGHRSLLLVTGTFADGSSVDLTYSSLSTYASSNLAVAKVAPNAFVTAVGPGSAEITITNNGASVVVPIKVAAPRRP